MTIPNAIRRVLLDAGLTPAEWKAIHAVFDSLPETIPACNIDKLHETVDRLHETAELLYRATRIRAIEALTFEGEQTWDEMTDKLFQTVWTLWGGEGVIAFADRFHLGKTTVFRWLHRLGIPSKAQRSRLDTIAAIRAEIERLEAELAELQQQEAA